MAKFARFPGLPNELKLRVIETTDPEDVENLALCCKLVYSLADKTLRQHKKDKDTWSELKFSFQCCRRDAQCLEAFRKLREIATNKRLGRYPKEVTILGRDYRLIPLVQHASQDDIIQACAKIFQDLESPYINQDEMKAWHKSLIDDGVASHSSHTSSSTAKSLLLTLLPNVDRISIGTGQSSAEMSNTIRTISTVNRDAPLFVKNRLSLTKLSELHLHSDGGDETANGATGILEAFMTLPSLRSLGLAGIGRRYELNNFLDPTPPSNVTEIICSGCTLSTTQLARLLDHVDRLQIFSYDQHRLRFHGNMLKEISPAALLEIIFQYAKTSLRFLNYSTNAIVQGREVELEDVSVNAITPIGSFRGYEALEVLHISCVLLFEDSKGKVPKRLINELPTSLEALELVGDNNLVNAQLMFAGMLEMKRERLPNLRCVMFDRRMPFDEGTITAYERAGLKLIRRKVDDTGT